MARIVPTFREATLLDADEVAADLGQADIDELRLATGGLGPREACRSCVQAPGPAWCIGVDGHAVCIFGALPQSLLQGEVVIWAVHTRRATSLPLSFWRWSLPGLRLAVVGMPWATRLVNTVHVRHVAAIRWLTRLGARFGVPFAIAGGGGELFVPFEIDWRG